MVICDTSILTEQRFILSDGVLHFFTCLFLLFYSYTLNFEKNTQIRKILSILCGLLLGMPCSTKNTAWGLMAYVAFNEIYQCFVIYKKFNKKFCMEVIERGLSFFIPLLIVYAGSFIIHIIVLPYYGPGIFYLDEIYMKQFLSKRRKHFALFAKRLTKPSLLKRFLSLVIDMHKGNMDLTDFHPSHSRPINWPLLTGRYVDFWAGFNHEIQCLGNPFVYYFVFLSLIISLIYYKNEKYAITFRNIVGWSVSYFPFYLVPRTMYLYHYIIPLIFGCINAGMILDFIRKPFWKGFISTFIVFFILLSFYIYSPFSYGTVHIENELIIPRRWYEGDDVYKQIRDNPPPAKND